eukprot:SAG31_NODE_5760_length_2340_cov_3.145917_2_plen_190_part_00
MFPDTMMRKAIRTVSPATHVRQRATHEHTQRHTHARRDAEGHARRHAWNTVAQWHTQLPGRQQPAARYARQGEARPKPRAHLSATPSRTLFASTIASAFCPFRRRLMMTAAGAVRHHPSTCHPKRPCTPHTQQHTIRTAQGRAAQGSAGQGRAGQRAARHGTAEHRTGQGRAQQHHSTAPQQGSRALEG